MQRGRRDVTFMRRTSPHEPKRRLKMMRTPHLSKRVQENSFDTMLKRWTKFLLKGLLALFVLLFLFLLFERVRGQISLARYKRELIAKGEKLTFRELIPP